MRTCFAFFVVIVSCFHPVKPTNTTSPPTPLPKERQETQEKQEKQETQETILSTPKSPPAGVDPFVLPEDPPVEFFVLKDEKTQKEMIKIAAAKVSSGCDANRRATCLGELVPAFWIDRTPVSNAKYQECVDTARCKDIASLPKNKEPLQSATWVQAKAYCNWRGKDLVSEAQWERARESKVFEGEAPSTIYYLREWYVFWGKTRAEDNYAYNGRLLITLNDSYRYGADPDGWIGAVFRCARPEKF